MITALIKQILLRQNVIVLGELGENIYQSMLIQIRQQFRSRFSINDSKNTNQSTTIFVNNA